jgi:hypothetical protein
LTHFLISPWQSSTLICLRRFGFANPEALANGLTGTACRGEEHDVTVVWSVASGKRLILADGHEVHYSNSRSGIIDVSWTMRGNHVMKVLAHASPPLSATPGFRQYDFFVDGLSFFSFPKVFRLGLAANDPRGFANHAGSASVASGRSYNNNLEAPTRNLRRRNSSTIATLEVEAPHNMDEVCQTIVFLSLFCIGCFFNLLFINRRKLI